MRQRHRWNIEIAQARMILKAFSSAHRAVDTRRERYFSASRASAAAIHPLDTSSAHGCDKAGAC